MGGRHSQTVYGKKEEASSFSPRLGSTPRQRRKNGGDLLRCKKERQRDLGQISIRDGHRPGQSKDFRLEEGADGAGRYRQRPAFGLGERVFPPGMRTFCLQMFK